jgi:2-succinyl-5-enolpyruvyl-6-hydroxy-3-cyclohexene-1-carboxylate synthase
MPGVTVHANRGANGIDGVVSTAVGVAIASGSPTTLLIGDVACLHDANGLLGLASRGLDVDIVVVNNDGGAIFSFLPQRAATDDAEFEVLWGTPHGVSFGALAAAHSIAHVAVGNARELAGVLGPDGVRLVEVRTDRVANIAAHDALNAAVAAAMPPH